jgi:hypothetical protein
MQKAFCFYRSFTCCIFELRAVLDCLLYYELFSVLCYCDDDGGGGGWKRDKCAYYDRHSVLHVLFHSGRQVFENFTQKKKMFSRTGQSI